MFEIIAFVCWLGFCELFLLNQVNQYDAPDSTKGPKQYFHDFCLSCGITDAGDF